MQPLTKAKVDISYQIKYVELYFSGSDMKSDYPLNAGGLLSAQSQAAFFTEVIVIIIMIENFQCH